MSESEMRRELLYGESTISAGKRAAPLLTAGSCHPCLHDF